MHRSFVIALVIMVALVVLTLAFGAFGIVMLSTITSMAVFVVAPFVLVFAGRTV